MIKHYTQSIGRTAPSTKGKNDIIGGDKQFTTEAFQSLQSLFVKLPSKFFRFTGISGT